MIMKEYNKDGECDYVCGNNNKCLRYFLTMLWNREIEHSLDYKSMFIDNKKKFVEFDLSNGRRVGFYNLGKYLENSHLSVLDLPDFDESIGGE